MVAYPAPRKPDQEKLVEAYLDEHPHSTVVQVRDGIEHETGIRIERVQARIDRIGKRRALIKGTGDYGRTAYALGRRRRRVGAGGIELRLVVTEGEGVSLVTTQQGSDIDSPELRALLGQILACARRAAEAKAVPLAEAVARAEGLLHAEDEPEPEDNWLDVLSAYQVAAGAR